MIARARDQRGFTLVEMLVAMAAGMVVLFGLTEIFITTLGQTQHTFTRIESTQQARTALTTIENELHGACLDGDQAPPIQAGSGDNQLIFLSYSGTSATPTPVWHIISLSGGTLTDTSYGVTGSAPNWSRATNPTSSVQLLGNASALGSKPVFQYFAYQGYQGTDGNTYWTIPDGSNPNPVTGAALAPYALGTPLVSANAANTVEVLINLLVGPSGDNLASSTLTSEDDPVQDAVSLRLTTPPDYSPGPTSDDYGPCQ